MPWGVRDSWIMRWCITRCWPILKWMDFMRTRSMQTAGASPTTGGATQALKSRGGGCFGLRSMISRTIHCFAKAFSSNGSSSFAPVDRDTAWRDRVLMYGLYHGPITVMEAARILGVSDRTARTFLRKLLDERILLPEGNKRVHAYKINDSYLKANQPPPLRF